MREEKYIMTIVAIIAIASILSMMILNHGKDTKTIIPDDNIGFTAHQLYPSFEQPINKFAIDRNNVLFSTSDTQQTLTININDTAIFSTAYISINSGAWQQVTLTGTQLGGSWLTGYSTGTIIIPQGNNTPDGISTDNYIIIYSCTRNTTNWDCHNNKWQLMMFNTTKTSSSQNNITYQDIPNPYGKVYYVSSSIGNDSNNGTSSASPWKTLSKVSSATLKAGDMILLKKGDIWREKFLVPASGNLTNNIIFSNYGVGNNPQILGSEKATNWVNQGNNIWKSSTSLAKPWDNSGGYTANIFFVNNDLSIGTGRLKGSLANLTTEYDWYWESNSIYIYSTVEPSTRYSSVEVTERDIAFGMNKKSYITVDGINTYFAIAGIHGGQSVPTLVQNGLIVRDCESAFHGYPDAGGYGMSIVASDSLVENNSIHDCGRRGVSIGLYATITLRNITVQNNHFYNGYHTTSVDIQADSGSGLIDSIYIRNNTIEERPDYNPVSNPMLMFVSEQTYAGAVVSNIYLINNVFKYPPGPAINIGSIKSIYLYGNTFYGHNTVRSGSSEFLFIGGSNLTARNNIFYSQLPYDTNGRGYTYYIQNKTGIDSDYNIYYRVSPNLTIIHAYNPYIDYHEGDAALIRSQYGWEAHSLFIDPKFTSSSDSTLKPDSPAINAGIDVGLPYKGSAPDMGAYETDISTTPPVQNPYGKTYYISSSIGSDSNDGLSTTTPWKTIAKVNSTTFKAGDQILFKRGETFYGSIVIKNSGNSTAPIIYGAYGTGEKPVITGFTQVAGWNNLGGNIWESTNQVSNLPQVNMVTIDGVNTAVGRYPNVDAANGGYLTVLNHSAKTSIISNDLTGTPDWTGAEVVIRAGNFHSDRSTITSQSGGTLNFNNITDGTADGYGFFIQSDPKTLDSQGEWYYSPTTHKIQAYSASQPGNVKVSSIDTLALINANYIIINDISFTGANTYVFYAWDHQPRYNHVTITDDDFLYTGVSSIYTLINNLNIENSTFLESNRNAICVSYGENNTIRNNTVKNIGVLAGMRPSTSNQPNSAVESYVTNNLTIEYNTINNTGFNPISFYGTNILVKNNHIDTFCTMLDDCGGIYTFTGPRTLMNNVIITGNIIVNGIGTPYGVKTQFPAGGIYLDEQSANVEVAGNSVANVGQFGIFMTSAGNINTHDNTIYNASQFQYYSTCWGTYPPPKNNKVNDNIFVSTSSTVPAVFNGQNSLAFYFVSYNGSNNTQDKLSSTVLDNNYYARPLKDDKVVFVNLADWNACFKTLSEWQSYSGQDLHSHKSPKSITNMNDMRFEYNPTQTAKTITLDVPYIDVKNVTYSGILTLQPYSSIVLIKK